MKKNIYNGNYSNHSFRSELQLKNHLTGKLYKKTEKFLFNWRGRCANEPINHMMDSVIIQNDGRQ